MIASICGKERRQFLGRGHRERRGDSWESEVSFSRAGGLSTTSSGQREEETRGPLPSSQGHPENYITNRPPRARHGETVQEWETGAEMIQKPDGQERDLKSLLWAEERELGKPRRLLGRVEKQV